MKKFFFPIYALLWKQKKYFFLVVRATLAKGKNPLNIKNMNRIYTNCKLKKLS